MRRGTVSVATLEAKPLFSALFPNHGHKKTVISVFAVDKTPNNFNENTALERSMTMTGYIAATAW